MSQFLAYVLTGLGIGAGYALVGSGLVAIYRVTRVVNFAQGAFAVIAALSASSLLASGVPHVVAEGLAVVVGAAVGLLVGLVAIGKPGTTRTEDDGRITSRGHSSRGDRLATETRCGTPGSRSRGASTCAR